MQRVTFMGEIHEGRLHTQQPLSEFEGRQVMVTLTAADAKRNAGEQVRVFPPQAASEAEILEDTGRIRRPARAAATLTAQVVSIGQRKPRILAEEG